MRILWELFITFFKIGAFTFGGGYAMIPLIQTEVCYNKNWVKEEDIVDLLALAQTVPGAIAVNASTFIGYRIFGFRGALAATLGVVLPSFLIILSLAGLLIKYGDNQLLEKMFTGIRAVVVSLIMAAVIKLYRPCIIDHWTLIIAVAALFALIIFNIHPIIAIIGGGAAGYVIYMKYIVNYECGGKG
ncbi:MAG: chromate transporter [Clostridiaceae bacterium BRH_c20a]|nr:MAG: chromate transporter [Clostridiaceae bacterium BRH_c20a]